MGSAAPVYAVFSKIIQEIRANICWTSSIYTAVPPAMESSTFRFQQCSAVTTATAMISGAP